LYLHLYGSHRDGGCMIVVLTSAYRSHDSCGYICMDTAIYVVV